MDVEISYAVDFLMSFFGDLVTVEKSEELTYRLTDILLSKYSEHWYPEQPSKGNAYRCINVMEGHLDPTLVKALQQCQLPTDCNSWYFPENLSLWVDPNEVSYRYGDRGPVQLLYPVDGQCPATYDPKQWHAACYTDQHCGQYYMPCTVSCDAEMYNNDSEFFTYRGEVFNKRVWTEEKFKQALMHRKGAANTL